LVGASRNPAASAYLGFLRGPQARAIFRRYGFGAAS
jgi:ABC-type molybdate transport system substrate-binding protein